MGSLPNVMRVGELRGNIEFAQDVFGETTLDEARQRAIDQSRAKNSIATYLVRLIMKDFSIHW